MHIGQSEQDNNDPDIIGTDEFGIPLYKEINVGELVGADCSETGSRVIISKIVIENFKSYAGVKVLGPFHKNFTAIIGPNGSGKSNVIDSILFVFGFRATKIRSKKLSVLIHDSNDNRGIDHCSVTVHFEQIFDSGNREDNHFNIVEGSQFEVSRSAFKDGSSFYKLNDRKVHFREIEKVLMTAGVDLVHNRFLILQGEVEQIALMKPKSLNKNEDGMLEFLEDIIGSARFKDPIKLIAGRLTDLTEIKTEKYQRVKQIEGEKNELADERHEALTFLQLENDITQAKNKIYQKDLYSTQAVNEESKKTRVVVDEEAKEINKKCQEVISLIKEKNNVYTEFIKKCNKRKNEKDKNKEKFQWYEEQDVKIQEEVKHLFSTVKKLEKKIQQDKTSLQELQMIPEKQEKDIEVMKKKMEKMEVEKKELEQKFDELVASFQDETKDLQASKFKMETELLEVQKTVNDHKKKYQLSQGELDLLKSSQNKEANKMTDIKRSASSLEASKKEKILILNESEERFPGIKDALEKAKKEFEVLNRNEGNKRLLISELSTKVEIARSHLDSAQNQNKVLDFLMSLKRSGKMPSIYGRLGDLGAIDEKYDVAISTACGLLDYIVVDDMNCAQRCIEELRSANVGRASFIGLDKMAVWKEQCRKKNRTFPENVPRLFDLVKINNPDLEPAFYFALRDTLVAKDIHQATRIAYGSTRYRVVTLKGELIDLSGSMSGGGNRVAKGKMGTQIKADVNPKELQKMESELDKVKRDRQAGQENIFRLQQSIETLQKSHREVATCIHKLTNEIKSIQDQLDGFMTQIKQLEEKVKKNKPDEKRISEQERKVEALKTEYDKKQKVATDMEEQIHKVHNELMEIGGSQFKSIETKKDGLESQLEQHRSTISKLTVSVKTAQRKATKTESGIESMRNEMKEASEKLILKREEKGKIEIDADKLLDVLNKNEADLMESQTELARISEVISEYTEKEKESKRLLQDANYRLEKAQEDEKQSSEKLEAIKSRINSLQIHDVDDRPKETLIKLSDGEAAKINSQELKISISAMSTKLETLKPNMASIQEYKKKQDIYFKRVEEYTKISTLKENQKKMHDELKKRRNDEFMTGYSRIKSKLKEMYQAITLGGNAELELVDTMDAFAEGIVFSVRPPKKSWKNISNLSGGEKTLSSLALIFALHQYKATPFYVMDEIDAALDFKNASIIANYIKHRTENAQFIVISLRSNTFELCDRLVGIYKTFNCTKSITINLARNKIDHRLKNKNASADTVSSLSSVVTNGKGKEGENEISNGGDGLMNDVFSKNNSVDSLKVNGVTGRFKGGGANTIGSSGAVESSGPSIDEVEESGVVKENGNGSESESLKCDDVEKNDSIDLFEDEN